MQPFPISLSCRGPSTSTQPTFRPGTRRGPVPIHPRPAGALPVPGGSHGAHGRPRWKGHRGIRLASIESRTFKGVVPWRWASSGSAPWVSRWLGTWPGPARDWSSGTAHSRRATTCGRPARGLRPHRRRCSARRPPSSSCWPTVRSPTSCCSAAPRGSVTSSGDEPWSTWARHPRHTRTSSRSTRRTPAGATSRHRSPGRGCPPRRGSSWGWSPGRPTRSTPWSPSSPRCAPPRSAAGRCRRRRR